MRDGGMVNNAEIQKWYCGTVCGEEVLQRQEEVRAGHLLRAVRGVRAATA